MFHEKVKDSVSSIIHCAVFCDRLRNAVILYELCKSLMS